MILKLLLLESFFFFTILFNFKFTKFLISLKKFNYELTKIYDGIPNNTDCSDEVPTYDTVVIALFIS